MFDFRETHYQYAEFQHYKQLFWNFTGLFFIYKADRYDIVGKEYLKLINKYYVTDFGFKYYILNNKTIELSQILENLIQGIFRAFNIA